MRVMLDTNILISLSSFPSSATSRFRRAVSANHEIILCDYVIQELLFVVNRKFPSRLQGAKKLLNELHFDFVCVPQTWDASLVPNIRDVKDAPILAAAILDNVDILVTGDKDFLVLDLPAPKIMTMAEFIEQYG